MKGPARRAPQPRNPVAKRLVIGLVGDVCAGKSAAAAAFRKRGAVVLEADQLVHALYERADVKREVRRLMGPSVFDARGKVDRRKLGALVFSDGAQLKRLTRRVIYPRTGAVLKARVAEFRAQAQSSRALRAASRATPNARAGEPPALVLDAPLLFEARRDGWCDKRIFVWAPRARRERWARETRGWSAEELVRRERRMLDARTKRARCEAVIDNSGTRKDLDRQVGALWRRWIEEGHR